MILAIPFLIFSTTINDIIIYYETGEYDRVVSEGEKILKDFKDDIGKDDLINLQTYIAFSYIALGDTINGQRYFENILTLDNNYTLNEEFVSPKIVQVFLKAKERINFLIKEIPPYFNIETENNLNVNKKNIILKSLVFPGWGQMSIGEKNKSIVLGSIFLSSIIGSVTSYIFTLNMKDMYMKSTTEEDAIKNYDLYNNWSKVNRFFMDISFSVYIFNIFDIVW